MVLSFIAFLNCGQNVHFEKIHLLNANYPFQCHWAAFSVPTWDSANFIAIQVTSLSLFIYLFDLYSAQFPMGSGWLTSESDTCCECTHCVHSDYVMASLWNTIQVKWTVLLKQQPVTFSASFLRVTSVLLFFFNWPWSGFFSMFAPFFVLAWASSHLCTVLVCIRKEFMGLSY